MSDLGYREVDGGSMMGYACSNTLAVMLAAKRVAERCDEQHGRGLTLLATIAATAPFVGVLGTLYWIVTLFTGGGGEKSAMQRLMKLGLSHALWFTAAGLAIGIVSYAGYRYFRERREKMRGEMRAAVVELVSTLRAWFVDRFSMDQAQPYRESRFASAERAMERSARDLSHGLRRRIPNLTSMAATAPMMGTLAAVAAFTDSFGVGHVKYIVIGEDTANFAAVFLPMVVALLAAIVATWSKHYLLRTSADLDAEICIGSNELLNTLALATPALSPRSVAPPPPLRTAPPAN